MAFFFSDNPIALFLALVVVVVVLKQLLAKHSWFSGGKSAYILPVVLAVAVLLIAYNPLLRILSFGIPFLILILLFVFGVGALAFALGMPGGTIGTALKGIGLIRITAYIVLFSIAALAISRVYGERLLEDRSVSIADAMTPAQETVKIDFSPMFTKQALGAIVLVVVLGAAFVFVNTAK